MTTTQTNEKTAWPWSSGQDPRAAAHAAAGNQVLNTFLLGAGTGVGGVGLYHMLRKLKERQKQLTSKPSLSETALNVNLPDAPVKAAFDAKSLALPLGGAGAGALLGATLSKKKNRLRNALAGGALGGVAGFGANALTDPANQAAVKERVGETATKSITPGWSWLLGLGGRRDADSPLNNLTPSERANLTTATVAAGGAGLMGGGYALNTLLKNEEEKKQRDDVAASRDAYFNELIGGNEKISAALDALYDKRAALSDYIPTVGGALGAAGRGIYNVGDFLSGGTLGSLSEGAQTAVGLGSLGAAGLGAMHMYNKTMAKSHAKNIAAAAAARRRMQMANTPWVDPTDLAKIKDLAAASESPSPQMG